jgi:protoporphyrinogen/coproporphyrinogen III oxidase
MERQVLIIGAGITGLTAAYEVARRGGRPIVYEASSRAGGLIRTEQVEGFTIEAGPDSVLGSKPAGVELIRELGLESDLLSVRPPGGAFVLRGRTLHALPQPSFLGIPLTPEALARYDLLPEPARARMALESTIPSAGGDGDESVAAFFRRRFGPETVDLIAQPLLGGIHAGDIEQLSMRSLFPRLLDLERVHGSVTAGLRDAPADGTAASSVQPSIGAIKGFASLKGGMGSLVRALEARLPPGTVRYHSPIARLDDIRSGHEPVIVAAPAFAAAALLAPIDADAARLCAQVPYVSTASVALAWPRTAIAHPLTGTGFVVARRHSDVRITACTWVSSKWESRAPGDSVLLRVFLGGAHDPDVASLADAELTAIVRRDLGAVLGITADPSLARVYRWPNAGAQHTVGHLDRVAAIEHRLSGHGIFVAGSGFRSVGIPDCIADARRVALLAASAL